LLVIACAEPTDRIDTPPPPVDAPTYYQDVRPILAEDCGGCHLPGGVGPFAFDEYESTRAYATAIADAVEDRRMPPWGALDTAECAHPRPFAGDLRLSQQKIGILRRWADQGAAEGERPSTVAPFTGELSSLARVDLSLAPATSYTVVGPADGFRCFVLDPGFVERAYLRGIRFAPGNDLVVHHAIVYADPAGASADLQDENGQYDCFGGPGFTDTFLVGAWAPGGIPFVFPERAAMPIEVGTKLVLQIHYHPLREPQQDRTSIELMLDRTRPEYLAGAAFIGNFDAQLGEDGLLPGPNDPPEGPAFRIPANATRHEEQMRLRIPYRIDGEPLQPAYLHAVASHMHYVGTDMKIDLHRLSQSPACTSSELAPLRACLDQNCPGALGYEAYQCTQDFCSEAAGAISSFCGTCLQDQLFQNVGDAFPACLAPSAMPVDLYGPIPAQPRDECLLQTPKWDFQWQRFYAYDAEIEDLPFVMPGDTFELRCRYDNTMTNPFVRSALQAQGLTSPHDVVLGESTLDEMCLLALTYLYKEP
jgi:hypothetical protein